MGGGIASFDSCFGSDVDMVFWVIRLQVDSN